jgi:hypothetical protein
MKTTEALNNATAEREAHMNRDLLTNKRKDPDGEQYTDEYAIDRIINRAKEYQKEEEPEEENNNLKKYEQGIGRRLLPMVSEDFARETVRKKAEEEREITHERHPGTRFEPGYRTDGNGEYRVEQAGYEVEQRTIELFREWKEYNEAFKEQTKQQNFKS